MGSLRRYIAAGATFAWPLDGQPLQEARDRHTVTGNPTVVDSPYGKALSFASVADYVTLGAAWEDQTRFDSGSQDFSVVAWVRRTRTGVFEYIMGKEDGDNDGWRFLFWNNNTVTLTINNIDHSSSGTIADTDWHCIAAVVDRSARVYLYIDGAASGDSASVGVAMATVITPTIAMSAVPGSFGFIGEIAGIVIFNRILSAEECLQIAQGRAF